MNLFEEKVEKYFNDYFETVFDQPEIVVDLHQDKLDYGDENLGELIHIYGKRYKYRLDWAFEEAERRFINQLDFVKEQMDVKVPYSNQMNKLREEVHDHIQTTSRNFTLFSNLVEIIDIAISVFLILGITLVSTAFESTFESFVLLTVFVLIIALMKVILDRYLVIPKMNEWGWNRYIGVVEEIINISAISMAMKLAVIDQVEKDVDLEIIEQICLQGLESVKLHNTSNFIKRIQNLNESSVQIKTV